MARLVLVSVLAFGSGGCGLIGGSPAPTASTPAPSPTLLPQPKPISSPKPGTVLLPSPLGSPSPSVPPTRVPPPDLNAKPQASAGSSSAPRVKVANTEGQGANMRAEPSPTRQLLRTIKDGTELELIGEERGPGDGNGETSVTQVTVQAAGSCPSC